MHIFFSGIGGTGIGPLALIAHEAGYEVSGSDKQNSGYIQYLQTHGITDVTIGQSEDDITASHAKNPIDWFVYSAAVAIEQPNSPEMAFCRANGIRMSQRAELLNTILAAKKLQMVAIAGTHGKTTTSAMAVWLFKQLGLPISYSFGAKTSFSDMGAYEAGSQYFVYEADEFARNFLEFNPRLSIIVGIDYDHPDIYPTREDYEAAFRQFVSQSHQVIAWRHEINKLSNASDDQLISLDASHTMLNKFSLVGEVNRQNAYQVVTAVQELTGKPFEELVAHMNRFPGLSRRFEQLAPGLYTDYAHTPPKIRGAIQIAAEAAGQNVVVVYEGLHNTRQHFIKDELVHLFDTTKHTYVVPSYLAREDPNLALLSPADIISLFSDDTRARSTPSQLNEELKNIINQHLAAGDLVLCLSAGGGGSLDEWLRKNFTVSTPQ